MSDRDIRTQRPGLSQIGEVKPGRLASFDSNGRIQDAGENGPVSLPNLPTADPHVAGQLWTKRGVLMVSSG